MPLDENRKLYLELVRDLPEFNKLEKSLEEEGDIFLNLYNIQIHKRNLSLNRLYDKIKTTPDLFTNNFLENFILPICKGFIGDNSNRKNNYLVDSAINLLALGVANLNETRFKHYLNQFLNLAISLSETCSKNHEVNSFQNKLNSYTCKQVSNIVVAILNHKQFFSSENLNFKAPETFENENDKAMFQEIKFKIIPKLLNCMNEGKNILSRVDQVEGVINIIELNYKRLSDKMNLAVASIQLGKVIQDYNFIEKIIFKITSLLRSKDFEIRSVGMKNLEKIVSVDNLESIFNAIYVQLYMKGFHKHVQIFAINAMLSKVEDENIWVIGEKMDLFIFIFFERVAKALELDFSGFQGPF